MGKDELWKGTAGIDPTACQAVVSALYGYSLLISDLNIITPS